MSSCDVRSIPTVISSQPAACRVGEGDDERPADRVAVDAVYGARSSLTNDGSSTTWIKSGRGFL